MKARSAYALGFLTFGLMATTSLVQPIHSARAAADAQTGWAINRVVSAASGSYCTMAQKYSDNTVMTLAKNQAGEYSLALDFTKSYFPDAKPTTVSLRPAGANAQTFNVTPQTDRVVVIGLGKNDSFVKALKSSGKLDFEVGGQTHTFTTNKFSTGVEELSTCLASMKPAAAPTTETASDKPIDKPAAKTLTAKKPAEVVAAANAPINDQVIDLKTENAQLKQAMAQERQTYENQQSSSQAALAEELQEKLRLLQQENDSLRAQKNAGPQTVVDPKTAEDLAKAKSELAAAQSLNQTLQSQSSQIAQQQKINGASAQQLGELQKQNEDLKAQIASLQSKAAIVAPAPMPIPTTQRIDQTALKENAELKQQLAALQEQVKNTPVSQKPSPEEMKVISSLQVENANLKQQLSAAASKPQQAEVSSDTVQMLKNKLELAQTENQSLKKQIDAVQSDADGKLKVASSNNWDLEQATTRYQESQREIRRLGTLVDTQKTQCSQQKKEIEAMLFDPAVSDKAQQEKFHSMEDQIAQLQAQIKQPQQDEAKVAELEKKLADAQAAQAKLVDLQQQLQTAQATQAATQAKMSELEKQAQNAQAAQASVQTAQAQAQAAQAKIAELEKQAQAAQVAQASAQTAQAQAQAAQAKIAELEKQQAVAAQSAQAAQVAQAQVQAVQASNQAAQAKIAELEKQQAITAQNAQAAQIAQAQAQAAQLELQKQAQATKATQMRVAQLEAQLNTAKIAPPVAAPAIAPAAGVPVQSVADNDLPVPTATRVTPVAAAALAPSAEAPAAYAPAPEE